MNESESALPLDSSFWEHIKHIDFTIGIQISEDKVLNIIGALEDIYKTICDEDKEEAKLCVTALAAILVASKYDKADEVWAEYSVLEAMSNFDEHMKEILDEES